MRRLLLFLGCIALLSFPATVEAQQEFTNDKIEYTIELATANWKAISVSSPVREEFEFVNGDRLEGLLQIRKQVVDANVTPSELARQDQDTKLHYRPGFVAGKEEKFVGRLSGVTITYEYTHTGKAMMGRIYYLQADSRTIYMLHFTGLRDRLARIRNQTDVMARSFKLKN